MRLAPPKGVQSMGRAVPEIGSNEPSARMYARGRQNIKEVSNRIIQRTDVIGFAYSATQVCRAFLPFLVGWIRKNLQMESNVVDAEQAVGNPARTRGGAACLCRFSISQGANVHYLLRWNL